MSGNRSRKLVRQSRALGIALSPKAEKYMQRRSYRPGEHGRGRVKDSDYSVRLKEKQRLRAQYGIREAQVALALRAGFARTLAQDRQVVVLRHLLVDGKIVDRPSYRVRPGQVVQVKPRSQASPQFHVAAQGAHRDVLPQVPDYLDVDLEKLRFTLVRRPKRAEVPVICDVQMVVEHYSR